jgi:pSer/pThr/pTyr-binding forkhead associated (FHA) protein
MAAMLSSAQGVSHALERLFHSKEEISIGRNPSNTIVLNATISREKPIPDSLVLQLSRHHAKLAVKDGELQIMDNSTLNGTFINNLRIPARTWRVLKNGDVISLGG